MFWTIQSTAQYENEEKHRMVWIREAEKNGIFLGIIPKPVDLPPCGT